MALELRRAGWRHVRALEGGWDAWKAAGLDPAFLEECLYGPGAVFIDEILSVDRDAGVVRARMPTPPTLPLTSEQRGDPRLHPPHVSGALMVHATGILGPGTTPNPGGVRNIDFDVMEVANGAKASDYPELRQVRRDWLSLLQQGVVKPATGVSDSHRLTVEHAGWARTYVLGAGDDPTRLDLPRFNERVRAGAMLPARTAWRGRT